MYCARQEKITVIEAIPYKNFKERWEVKQEILKQGKKFKDLGGVLYTYNREVAI